MKYLKRFEEHKIEKGIHGDRHVDKETSGVHHSIPVYTTDELNVKKAEMLKAFKEDPKMKHLSDDDLKKTIDTFYLVEIKHGMIIIDDDEGEFPSCDRSKCGKTCDCGPEGDTSWYVNK